MDDNWSEGGEIKVEKHLAGIREMNRLPGGQGKARNTISSEEWQCPWYKKKTSCLEKWSRRSDENS